MNCNFHLMIHVAIYLPMRYACPADLFDNFWLRRVLAGCCGFLAHPRQACNSIGIIVGPALGGTGVAGRNFWVDWMQDKGREAALAAPPLIESNENFSKVC